LPQTHPRHRHILLLPLLLFCVITPLVLTLASSQETHSSAGQEFKSVTADGAVMWSQEEAKISHDEQVPLLENGNVLVNGEGIAQLRIGSDMDVIGIHGAFNISRYGDSISIASLTTPVLVRQGDNRLLVPVRQQWHASLSQPLPSGSGDVLSNLSALQAAEELSTRFFEQQIRLLSKVSVSKGVDILPEPRQAAPRESLFASLMLPGAAARSDHRHTNALLGALRAQVEAGDAAGVDALLSDEDSFALMETPHGRAVLAMLAGRAGNAGVRAPILAMLSHDSDLWLLMSQHPKYHSYAWLFGSPPSAVGTMLIGWFAYPVSALGFQNMISGTVNQWQQHVIAWLEDKNEASTIVSALLAQSVESLQKLHGAGYPQRAAQFAAALSEIAIPFERMLTPRSERLLEMLQSWDDVQLEPLPASVVEDVYEEKIASENVQQEVEVPFDADEVVQATEAALSDAGALITLETSISALSPTKARVESVVFSTATRDRVFDFTYDIETRTVAAIVEDDEGFLHALSLEHFVNWVFES